MLAKGHWPQAGYCMAFFAWLLVYGCMYAFSFRCPPYLPSMCHFLLCTAGHTPATDNLSRCGPIWCLKNLEKRRINVSIACVDDNHFRKLSSLTVQSRMCPTLAHNCALCQSQSFVTSSDMPMQSANMSNRLQCYLLCPPLA